MCLTTWGLESEDGQPITVALNGRAFAGDADGRVRHRFVGMHVPALLYAYFPQEATTLVLQFDSQPTNGAGMGDAVGDCAQILNDATVALLRGDSIDPPQCYWSTSTQLVAFLSMSTNVGPGATIGLRSGVLWPLFWPAGAGAMEAAALKNTFG